jgi:hypothetical protein
MYLFIYLFIVYLATLSTEIERVSPHVIKHLLFCIYFLYFYSLFRQFIGSTAGLDGDSFVISFMSVLLAQYAGHGAAVSRTEGGSIILNIRYLFS